MRCPVGCVGGLVRRDPVSGYIRDEPNRRRLQIHAGQDAAQRFYGGLHHPRVECVRRAQYLAQDPRCFQLEIQLSDRWFSAGNDQRSWRVPNRQIEVITQVG